MIKETCEGCNGDGYIDRNGHEIMCAACHGSGHDMVDCENCDTLGFIHADCPVCG